MKRSVASLLLGFALALAASGAQAQPKPIRLIVPYPPGGPLDIVARALVEKVQPVLGKVIVDNRPYAGGNLGADMAARAAPDGTTLMIGAVATHAINPWLNYGSGGNGSAGHLAGEMFKSQAGVFMVHIPYFVDPSNHPS